MTKAFKTGYYLNAWGKAFVAIHLGKTAEEIRAIYKSGILEEKISKENSVKWSKMFREQVKNISH